MIPTFEWATMVHVLAREDTVTGRIESSVFRNEVRGSGIAVFSSFLEI
jgi:hypothetical protein